MPDQAGTPSGKEGRQGQRRAFWDSARTPHALSSGLFQSQMPMTPRTGAKMNTANMVYIRPFSLSGTKELMAMVVPPAMKPSPTNTKKKQEH